ncbi:hypothetical protein DAMA08_035070 [Martiniozyma asiatica (nom. inval.)]|nr:hypothetical protein DAMA08_035070 [Martiniozyma asiatica]
MSFRTRRASLFEYDIEFPETAADNWRKILGDIRVGMEFAQSGAELDQLSLGSGSDEEPTSSDIEQGSDTKEERDSSNSADEDNEQDSDDDMTELKSSETLIKIEEDTPEIDFNNDFLQKWINIPLDSISSFSYKQVSLTDLYIVNKPTINLQITKGQNAIKLIRDQHRATPPNLFPLYWTISQIIESCTDPFRFTYTQFAQILPFLTDFTESPRTHFDNVTYCKVACKNKRNRPKPLYSERDCERTYKIAIDIERNVVIFLPFGFHSEKCKLITDSSGNGAIKAIVEEIALDPRFDIEDADDTMACVLQKLYAVDGGKKVNGWIRSAWKKGSKARSEIFQEYLNLQF